MLIVLVVSIKTNAVIYLDTICLTLSGIGLTASLNVDPAVRYLNCICFVSCTKQIQFKYLTAGSTFKDAVRPIPDKVKQMVSRYITAFANHEGGHIFFGIDDVKAAAVRPYWKCSGIRGRSAIEYGAPLCWSNFMTDW
jgi:hypothetical protein